MKGKIFNTQEVQAIIAGTKTMFREVIKTQTKTNEPLNLAYTTPYRTWEWGNSGVYVEEPYEVGQKIFCKENFVDFRSNNSDIFYKSDFEINNLVKTANLKWKPAQHMKQEHSRITLQITSIGVERLGDISEEDAIVEGVPLSEEFKDRYYTPENNYAVPKIAFMRWWNSTHKKPEEKFEANPFVWVVEFKINK